jgi:hypothetical protein
MQLRYFFISFLLVSIIFSCEKEGIDIITVEGVVRDDASWTPISGIFISIDGIKSPSGMGIITDGKRQTAGRTTTDVNGYYKVRLKVFEEAERLEFYLNPAIQKQGYVERQQNVYLSAINRSGSNKLDFTLSPTALLKITFKNANPVSDSDFFYFGWMPNGNGWTREVIQKENCGSVAASEALTWTGKDVCGTFTVEAIAEKYTQVYWMVIKNGITNRYSDSAFVQRGVMNEFSLNY